MTLKQFCLVLAAVGVSGGAHAQAVRYASAMDGATVARIRTGDLNLSSDNDARVMLSRIRLAAQDVCGERPASVDLDEMNAYDQCLQSTEADAVGRLGSTKVAELSGAGIGTQLLASR